MRDDIVLQRRALTGTMTAASSSMSARAARNVRMTVGINVFLVPGCVDAAPHPLDCNSPHSAAQKKRR